MNYKEFLISLHENLNITRFHDYRSSSDEKDRIGVSWSMGGTSGSCWDDKVSTISPSIEPNFTEIDSILEYYCPNISFIQYKTLSNKLIHREETHEGDYYGGSETYGHKYVYLEELFEWLKEKGYID